ncbi:MAG TPA: Holliday junction branch migration protein RuvA [Candidatus Treponema faecavium]|nr:Holliday junction branch migration protein RuvA [Candidatus Treponema faecavium]
MFNSLTGTITGKLPQTLYLDCGGIEWDIAVPDTTLDALPAVGSTARVYTWLLHREDAVRLFGFSAAEDRALFLNLLKVDGVGTRGALKIMSGISAEQLVSALDGEDIARLEKLPGVGRKTAQKMLLALKGKLSLESEPSVRVQPRAVSPWEDVIAALVNMGYERRMCEETVTRIAQELTAQEPGGQISDSKNHAVLEEQLFRRAIVELAQ